jgi:hypothetical protein
VVNDFVNKNKYLRYSRMMAAGSASRIVTAMRIAVLARDHAAAGC